MMGYKDVEFNRWQKIRPVTIVIAQMHIPDRLDNNVEFIVWQNVRPIMFVIICMLPYDEL